MATGNEILSYQGNANIGLNDDGIASYGETDTKDLDNSVFNLAYLNMQKNKEVGKQKIQERDDAMEQIAAGNLALKNALPEDRERLLGMVNDIKDVYFKNGGDVKSKPEVWLDLQDKLAKFKTQNTVAQSRLIEYGKGIDEAAKETNPVIKQKMLQHYETERKKDLNEPFLPYQQTMDWDATIVLPDLPLVTSAPSRSGYYDVDVKKTDMDKAYADYINRYQYNDKKITAPNVDAFYENYFGLDGLKPTDAVIGSVDLVNKKLQRIAHLNGYDINNIQSLPEYLRPLQVGPDPLTGKIQSKDRKEVSAFKIALALKYQNTPLKTLNPAYIKVDESQARIKKYNADTEASRALAYQRRTAGGLNRSKARFWDKKASQTENEENLLNIFDDVTARAKITAFQTKDAQGKVLTSENKEVVWTHDLPKGFTQVLAGIDKDGKPVQLEPKRYGKNNAEYYDVAKSDFMVSPSGARYSPAEIKRAFQSQTKFTKEEDFINNLKKPKSQGGAGFEQDVELIGANGRGTAQSTIEALRVLNNKSRGSKTDDLISQSNDNVEEGGSAATSNDDEE